MTTTPVARIRTPNLVSERYEIRRIIWEMTEDIARLMSQVGAWEAGRDYRNLRWVCDPNDSTQHIRISELKTHHGHRNKRKRCGVWFYNFRYGPNSKIVWGSPLISFDPNANVDALWVNASNRSSHIIPEREISLTAIAESSVARSYSKSIDVEVTATASASGSYMGVEVGLEVSTKTGWSQSETNDRSASKSSELVIPGVIPELEPGEDFYYRLEKRRKVITTPYTINGHIDFKIGINFPDWSKSKYLFTDSGRSGKVVELNSVRQLLQFWNGLLPGYESMAPFLDECPAWAYKAYERLANPDTRLIQAVAELEEVNDQNWDIIYADNDDSDEMTNMV